MLSFLACGGSNAQDSGDTDDPSGSTSGPSDESGDEHGSSGGDTGEPTDPTTPTKPLVAKPVCETLVAGPELGELCSAATSMDGVCISPDDCDGESLCVAQAEGVSFSSFCAPPCNLSGPACPLGYVCTIPTTDCGGEPPAEGVCAEAPGRFCEDFDLPSGQLFEGPGGSLYHLSSGGPDVVVLRRRGTGTYDVVAEWSGDRFVDALRGEEQTLLLTEDTEISIDAAGASTSPYVPPTSLRVTYGVTDDGGFVRLEAAGSDEAFAALVRRDDAGTWTEVGPTNVRVHEITALETGFVARCQSTELCTSSDGETFTPLSLPAGAEFWTELDGPMVGGASPEDFFMRGTDGALHHHRAGDWVIEGPSGDPSGGDDPFRTFADGTVVFETVLDGATVTYVYGEDCWATSPSDAIADASLVSLDGEPSFAVDGVFDQLCFVPTRS